MPQDVKPKPNIVITLMSADRDEWSLDFKARYVKLFPPLANNVFVIGTDMSALNDQKIHSLATYRWRGKEALLLKFLDVVMFQLSACLRLLKIRKSWDLLILASFGELEVMPVLLAKILRKKVVIIQGGSYEKGLEISYRGKWRGLGRAIPAIASIPARISRSLADGLMVDTENAVKALGLERYQNKIFVCGITHIDPETFKVERPLTERKNIIGYIGGLSDIKGALNLAKALPLVLAGRKDIRFVFCGDGPLRGEIEVFLKASQCNGSVRLLGKVPAEAIPDYLNQMRLLVVPSYSEGVPKVVMEAFACGCPVLATSVGGIPDLVEDGKTGFIMPDNSPECIAKNIERVMAHLKLSEIIQNALGLVLSRYTYGPMVEGWRDALQKLMK